MSTKVEIAVQGSEASERIRDQIRKALLGRRCSSFKVAVAYATVAGVHELLDAIPKGRQMRSQWLLGLDDGITQPGAISLTRSLRDSEVRIVRSVAGTRFHPKLYQFSSDRTPETDVLVVGSANLTRAALSRNCEAVSILTTDDPVRRRKFARNWASLWSTGEVITEEALQAYAVSYAANRPPPRPRPSAAAAETAFPVETEVDPSFARTCWIECGSVTLRGRELEIKAEQAMFFGLQPGGGEDSTFAFETSDGKTVPMPIKYRTRNRMWRLYLSNDVPEVRVGLRPDVGEGQGRSELVAVFQRTSTARTFSLNFLHLESPAFTELRGRSAEVGFFGRTTALQNARQYGWC